MKPSPTRNVPCVSVCVQVSVASHIIIPYLLVEEQESPLPFSSPLSALFTEVDGKNCLTTLS